MVDEQHKSAMRRAREGLTYKNGQFSKTATFASTGTILVLIAYVISWLSGSTLNIEGYGQIVFPEFDSAAAIALLSILNGAYLGNNLMKAKYQPPQKPVE